MMVPWKSTIVTKPDTDRIAMEMQRRGWTNRELSRRTWPHQPIHPDTISDMLRGIRAPRLSTLKELARALEIPLAELIVQCPGPTPDVAIQDRSPDRADNGRPTFEGGRR